MTPVILLNIANTLEFTNHKDIVFWCLFLFAFFFFSRKSNLVPTSKEGLKLKHLFLLRENVQEFKHYLVVSMYWTKTI